jgi:hypothetical protein
MSDSPAQPAPNLFTRFVIATGEVVFAVIDAAKQFVIFMGGMVYLISDTLSWIYRTFVKREVQVGRENIYFQMVRVGIRSIPIITPAGYITR